MLAFSPSQPGVANTAHETWIRRHARAFRWIAPVTLLAWGAVGLGGCAKGTSATSADVSPSTTLARYPVGQAHSTRERSARVARTLSDLSDGRRLFAMNDSRGPALAPFEDLLSDKDRPLEPNGLCPPDMASVDDHYCVDKYEASLVEVLENGDERGWSPYTSVEGHTVRAVSEPGVVPQGYVSEVQAQEACSLSGKRLCRPQEWRKACMGPQHATYGYGQANEPGRCNDSGRSPVVALYASSSDLGDRAQWNWDHMNDPALNQLDGTVAKTGSHDQCTNGYGVYDMVGNMHEWVADPNGTFQGGYYQDTHLNGDGCNYKTTAHEAAYHDYSTGFRCCADVAP